MLVFFRTYPTSPEVKQISLTFQECWNPGIIITNWQISVGDRNLTKIILQSTNYSIFDRQYGCNIWNNWFKSVKSLIDIGSEWCCQYRAGLKHWKFREGSRIAGSNRPLPTELYDEKLMWWCFRLQRLRNRPKKIYKINNQLWSIGVQETCQVKCVVLRFSRYLYPDNNNLIQKSSCRVLQFLSLFNEFH